MNTDDLKERVEQYKSDIEAAKTTIKSYHQRMKDQEVTLDRLNLQRVKQTAILSKQQEYTSKMELKLTKYKGLYEQICASLQRAKAGVIELSAKNTQLQTSIHHMELNIERDTPKILQHTEAREAAEKDLA